jgi:hypothetical protein
MDIMDICMSFFDKDLYENMENINYLKMKNFKILNHFI